MKVKTGVSVRHVHLNLEDYNLLFDEELAIKSKINQPGQFAALQTVSLKNGDRVMENVRIIGPLRSYTQVEISRTDAYFFKLNPPVRASGCLDDSELITIVGPRGEITRKACIIANRHIHISKKQRENLGLDEDVYSVLVDGCRGGILHGVHIVEGDNSFFEMHIDTDDANAFMIKQGDEVEIIKTENFD